MSDLKQKIQVLAVKKDWSLTQIQFAEDYIDALQAKGANAPIPNGLERKNARAVMDRFLQENG